MSLVGHPQTRVKWVRMGVFGGNSLPAIGWAAFYHEDPPGNDCRTLKEDFNLVKTWKFDAMGRS